MANQKCLLIINPISGGSEKSGVAEKCIKRLRKVGIKVEVLYTDAPGDAHRFASMAAERGYMGAIAAGGDGTINEVASGLIGSNTALGIIPLGSGNGLARHLNIPLNVGDAADIIARKHIVDCDYCDANGKPFFCTFGLGFDAAVSERFARQRNRGLINYVKSAMEEYVNFHPSDYLIEANGKMIKFRAFLIAVCNASQYGNNAFIAPEASIKDGQMDVTLVHAGTPLTRPLVGVDLFTGLIRNNTISQTMKVKNIKIRRTESGPVHLDGEPLTMGDEITLTCHHGELKIFTTGEAHPVKPLITPIKYLINGIKSRMRK